MLYVLTNRVSEVLQGGCKMERPPSSKRTATVRRNGIREPVRDGIGVDGEREHQRICEGGSQRGSVGTCMLLVRDSYLRLSLTMT